MTSRASLTFCLLFLAQVVMAETAAKNDFQWKLFSYRAPAFFNFNGNSFVPLRTARIDNGYVLSAGQDGGFALDGSSKYGEANLSFIGPGLLRVVDPGVKDVSSALILEYGDLYLKVPTDLKIRLRFGDQDLQIEDAEFYLEVSVDGKTLKFRNIGHPIVIEKGLELLSGETLLWTRASTQPVRIKKPNLPSDIEILRNRHANNRHHYGADHQLPVEAGPADYHNAYVEGGVDIGVSRLGPTSDTSTLRQNLSHLGAFFDIVWAYSLSMSAVPRREDFVNRSNLRFGVFLSPTATMVAASRVAAKRVGFIRTGALVGLGSHGFALDALVGYQKGFVPGETSYFTIDSHLALGAQLTYRIDLDPITENDMGLVIGLRYGRTPMSGLATNPDGAAIVPQKFTMSTISTILGLSFMF